ncbi:MAG: cytochrome c [Opitutaceae bacterium]
MRYVYVIFLLLVVTAVSILGFRGSAFKKPPLEIFPDMDHQPKYKPQSPSLFFADGRTDRPVPAHTVPRGAIIGNAHLTEGKTPSGEWARTFPMDVTDELLDRGQDRFQIFCLPCHGALGDGNGITKQYGMAATPSYHDPRLREMAEGEIFNTITHGKNLMGRYGDKLTPADRWAVIAYVRALQTAAQGTVNDVPPANRSELGL